MTITAQPSARAPAQVYIALACGLFAVALAAIFIRYAQGDGMPSLVIAAGRLTISALILTPFALARHFPVLRGLTGREWLLALVAGFFLAIHFAAWISSLEYASVLISVVIVTSNSLFVTLLEILFLRARPARLVLFGLLVAVTGGIVIGAGGGGDGGAGSQPLLGASLALVGALGVAIYLVIGRRVRAKVPLLPYIWLVYGIAALFLLLFVALAGLPLTGYDTGTYGWVLLLALLPQLVGHTSFNFALRYLSATFVSIAAQVEPIASAFIAFLIFSELPTIIQVIGSGAVILGVIMATLGQRADDGTKSNH